jgi:protein gp37
VAFILRRCDLSEVWYRFSMADHSGIEWTDATWNPTIGCTKVSPGCDHCYAERITQRFRHAYPNGFALTLRPSALDLPKHWRRPRRVFVNSMSDLFHTQVPESYIGEVFAMMAACPQHRFQVLTKRAERLARIAPNLPWPSNVWMGVSVETREYSWRVDYLRRVPASVRFVSAEPLLGSLVGLNLSGIHWLIAGGESQVGARPAALDWFRELRDACVKSKVPFFLKQLGGHPHKRGGPMALLDGKRWTQWPSEQVALTSGLDLGDLPKKFLPTSMSRCEQKTIQRRGGARLHQTV